MSFDDISFQKGSRFLITGGAGFIGSNLADVLIEKNYFVRILDNFSTGKIKNIEQLINNPLCEIINGDIQDLDTCQKCCKGIDYVLHQAAVGSVPRSIEDPKTTTEVNVLGTLNMLIAARDKNVKVFVYASSSSVYGDEPTLPKREGREGKLLSPYAISKHTNELHAKNFWDIFGLPTIGLRYFNIFGPRQDPNSPYAAVIPLFIKQLKQSISPTIYGDGLQSRDFTYIDNALQANMKACLSPKEAYGDVFNIACGENICLNELYKILCELLQKDISPMFDLERPGDVKHSLADINKANNLLQYYPRHTFYKGLVRLILS